MAAIRTVRSSGSVKWSGQKFTADGALIEAFWIDREIKGEFIFIKPNGNCFIGHLIGKKLKGFIYKYFKIQQIFAKFKEAYEGKKSLQSIQSCYMGFKNYKDDTKIRGYGLEVSVADASSYVGSFSNS